jgi:coenzyme F420-0:L-glutamate ligase / coenzyme F420-1:gamma-L-glutamate ligase
MSRSIMIRAVAGLPEVGEGEPVGRLIAEAIAGGGDRLGEGDVVAISQKIVSKAEGRIRDLRSVEVGERARELGAELGKDPRLVQLILGEARSVLRAERGRLIVETRAGWICANAGIDASNVPGPDRVALLPDDADASARRIRGELREIAGVAPGVVIADSFGRPWRLGQTDVAIGCAGLLPLDDWRGRTDREGRVLAATTIAIADQVAAAADLARDKRAGAPAALIRGLDRHVTREDGPGAAALRRAEADDLFR